MLQLYEKAVYYDEDNQQNKQVLYQGTQQVESAPRVHEHVFCISFHRQ